MDLQASLCRGHKLYVRVYQPSNAVNGGVFKGFILFHHGYGAHTTLYDHGAMASSLTQIYKSACFLCRNQPLVLPRFSSKQGSPQRGTCSCCAPRCVHALVHSLNFDVTPDSTLKVFARKASCKFLSHGQQQYLQYGLCNSC